MDRYEKALELARAYYDKDANVFLDTIFPELKESRDKQIRKAIINSLDMPFPEDNLPGTDITYEEAVAWLEKQKDREWSEEDEKMLKDLIGVFSWNQIIHPDGYLKIDKCGNNERKVKEFVSWLKSLRPSWKPSVEQMNTLLSVEGILRSLQYDDKAKILASIYEQLKQFYP